MEYTRISADCPIDTPWMPAATTHTIVCENAGKFYGLIKEPGRTRCATR